MDAAVIHLVEQEQVEPATGLLVPLQDQTPGLGVTSPAVGLDRDGLTSKNARMAPRGRCCHHRRKRCRIRRRLGSVLKSLC